MYDIYIRKISIDKVRHLENLDIPICNDNRKHLILTGKNGSGKTSLLLRHYQKLPVKMKMQIRYRNGLTILKSY